MENNNVMPEILENDLIKYKNTVWNVKRINEELIKDFKDNGDYNYDYNSLNKKLIYDYNNCEDCYYSYIRFIDEILESITAIYRKVGKDYICIWERN